MAMSFMLEMAEEWEFIVMLFMTGFLSPPAAAVAALRFDSVAGCAAGAGADIIIPEKSANGSEFVAGVGAGAGAGWNDCIGAETGAGWNDCIGAGAGTGTGAAAIIFPPAPPPFMKENADAGFAGCVPGSGAAAGAGDIAAELAAKLANGSWTGGAAAVGGGNDAGAGAEKSRRSATGTGAGAGAGRGGGAATGAANVCLGGERLWLN